MRIDLVGPSYVERSLPFDAQRTINLYPVIDETQRGKEISALYGTPGLTTFCTAGTGPIRAAFASTNGRAFVVSRERFYEISSSGVATLRGTISSQYTICSIAENTTQLALCDGTKLYIYTYATDEFVLVTDTDFPGAGTVTFQDGYFIVNRPNTGEFYISALNDGKSWNALDFATAESSPDSLVAVVSAFGQIWLLGDKTTEVWYNTGDVNFPFSRVEGAKMQTGCAAAHTVKELDNSLFWLGQDFYGKGIVYRAQGYTPQRISTHAIEYALSQAGSLTNIRAYVYQQDGHLFYALTGGGLSTTLVYDASTQLWHERAKLESDGTLSTHIASTCIFAFGKHLVGDKSTGTIYEMSQDYYSDAGNPIRRQRVFTHVHNEADRFTVNELQVDYEYGVGLTTGQGSAPVAWLEVSEDAGKTWSPEYEASIGALGAYMARASWRRLGNARIFTFRVTISDPVKVAICGAYLH